MKIIIIWAMALSVAVSAKAQSFEAQQLLLDWQKLQQEKQILNDLYKGYDILVKGYTAIRDLSKGSFDLHKAFLDGLLTVSPAVRKYKKIADIISLQEKLIAAYTGAWSRFKIDRHFFPNELTLISGTYTGLFQEVGRAIGTLTTILTDGQWRASDAERLASIDNIYREMQERYRTLVTYNNQAALLSVQRAADERENSLLRTLYGMPN